MHFHAAECAVGAWFTGQDSVETDLGGQKVVQHLKEKTRNFRVQTREKTRLSSIVSQPIKVVVVVVVVIVVVVFVVVGLLVVGGVVVVIVGHRNLASKFDQNWVNNKSYILVVVFIVLVLLLSLIQKPSFKTCSDLDH